MTNTLTESLNSSLYGSAGRQSRLYLKDIFKAGRLSVAGISVVG